jgi:MinD-like ATPase involved in chromosome partitioning or flagellar assembly
MKTVFFYSFKGGVGRTQSMLNIAKYLAKDKKIAILDFDIYAPGISYLKKGLKKDDTEYFLTHFLNILENRESKIYKEKYIENIDIIPVFDMSEIIPYHHTLTNLSKYLYSIKESSENKTNNMTSISDDIFEVIKDDISKLDDYDYLFIDGRTGITEVSDIMFSPNVDMKVIISSYNQQNIQGTNDILNMLSNQKITGHKILRVLSPKPLKHREDIKGIMPKANLDDNIKLKEKFNWLDTYEIVYDDEIVINDFNAWEILKDDSKYKENIQTIANKVNDEFFQKRSVIDRLI